MKKILFKKLLFDCLTFFFIGLISSATIIWVFQAVNYLDIIVEDGRDALVYINYTLLNFPKIISKILPFALFFSFFHIISKYEARNELIILWNFGIPKILLINFFLKFSIVLMVFQILLTAYIVPFAQNISRSLIKSSNVDFFESFIKPKKFNDNIKGLTIYADKKDENGKLVNIYLKKDNEDDKFQITHAKNGEFKNINGSKVLVLYNGQTINGLKNKITNFNFSRSDFTLSQLETDTITSNKIQETETSELIKCLKKYFNNDLTLNIKQKNYINHNCTKESLDNIFKELYKRFVAPFYIPTLILISLMIMIKSKENTYYQKYKVYVFLSGIGLIILSETISRFIQNNILDNLKILLIPILIFLILYYLLRLNLRVKY